jgi:hypothetical protein
MPKIPEIPGKTKKQHHGLLIRFWEVCMISNRADGRKFLGHDVALAGSAALTGRCANCRLKVVSLVALLALLLSLPWPLFGQITGATITGQVSDPSGAVIPDAQVSIKNTASGIVRVVTTSKVGLYSAPNLLPGPYEVKFSAKGFNSETRSGIVLTVGGQLLLNVKLPIGQTNQVITVTSQVPTVDLTTSSVSGFVGTTTMEGEPLNGRDWTTLADLQPGVINLSALQVSTTAADFGRGIRGMGTQMAISGTRPKQNLYRLDGIRINDYSNGSPGSVVEGLTLGVDAIEEFSVLTANYDAEYGDTSGGVVNAITRSGTNQFHGDAYNFLRNSALDAANFFDNFTNSPKPPFKRNQFGVAAGGPIRRNRTFVFGDYEGVQERQGVTTLATVPSANARNGILNFPGGPATFPSGCAQTSPTQCTVTVSSLVQPYLPLWALPNAGLLAPGNVGIFSFDGHVSAGENFETIRIDQTFSPKDSLDGTWLLDQGRETVPDGLDTLYNLDVSTRVDASAEETHIFNPQVLNTFRLGFVRSGGSTGTGGTAINPLADSSALGVIPGYYAPEIDVGGITSFTAGVDSAAIVSQELNTYQVYDDAFITKGVHTLKFGIDFEREQNNVFSLSKVGGDFQFGSLEALLTNQPSKFAGILPGHLSERGYRQSIIGGYVQDDAHVLPTLTLNAGLRYEMATVPTEVKGELTTLRDPYTDTAPHLGSPFFSNPTLKDFEPRVGFAWDPFGKGTAIRGAFGMFDTLPLPYQYAIPNANSSPFVLAGSAKTPQGSFPDGAYSLIQAANTLRTFYLQPNPGRPEVLTWSLSLQHDLTQNLSAMVAYVGNHGVHQAFRADDMNMVLPTLTSAGYLWPYPDGSGTVLNPAIGRMDTLQWTNSTLYDGLQVQVTKSMAHGFQVQGSYTWSKAIDDGSSSSQGDDFANSISSLFFFSSAVRRGLADFNVAQSLVANYLWTIPTPRSIHGAAAWAISGWQTGGIVTLQSGLPFYPNLGGSGNGSSGDALGVNSTDPFDFPNILTGPGCKHPVHPGNVNYINLNCFGLPMSTPAIAAQCTPFPGLPGTCANLLGNLGRNSVIGPGVADFDASLIKNNQIKMGSENLNMEFRAEMFNALNHTDLAAPIDNSALFDSTGQPNAGAGMADSTSVTSREIQFALKVIW